MIHEFRNPIPVIIKENKREGYALYVQSGGMFENDIFTVCLCDTSEIIHCTTAQLLINRNHTFEIGSKTHQAP